MEKVPVFLLTLAASSAVAVGGCATTPRVSSGAGAGATRPVPACRTVVRALAGPADRPQAAVLSAHPWGYAAVWQEKRGTLRFLSVDREARPLAPNAEIVDRPEAPVPLAIDVDDDGFAVTWREGERWLKRRIDAHGRPRGDVSDAEPSDGQLKLATCAPSPEGPRCKTGRGELELPRGAEVRAFRLEGDDGAVIAADEQGLKLFVQACARR
jgi:hypothetical protein